MNLNVEIREVDGKKYLVKKCPGCGKELLFKVREQTIRLYCACAECGRKMEVEVIGEDYFEMLKAEEELKKAQANNDLDRQFDILRHQPELLNLRNEICKRLGNRVINI